MAAASPKKTDELMEKASVALTKTKYFETERLALKALILARNSEDFGRMARILMPLQEARRHRLQQALDTASGSITLIDESVNEDTAVASGCYLIQPPQVGADARRLRLLAFESELPIAIVCREPLTQLKLCPIVAIGPGVTIRTVVEPPDDPEDIDMAWFVGAMESLGDAAIERIDTGRATIRQLDQLVNSLDAIPNHEKLHQALEDVCRRAEREQAEQAAAAQAKAVAASRRSS